MPNLTAKQAEALALIEDNPHRVEATTRLVPSLLRINGNMERTLIRYGLIEESAGGIDHTRFTRNRTVTVTIHTWRLTEAGREALRSTL